MTTTPLDEIPPPDMPEEIPAPDPDLPVETYTVEDTGSGGNS